MKSLASRPNLHHELHPQKTRLPSLSPHLHLLLRRLSTHPHPHPHRRRSLSLHNTQITDHARSGNLAAAVSTFNRMPLRDVISWTSLLTAFAINGRLSDARNVFDQMPKRNTASWNAIVSAYIHSENIHEAYHLFRQMPEKNVVSYGAMITGFGKAGMVHWAEEVYKCMPVMWRDPVGSTALIAGYLRAGEIEEAVRVFEGMRVRDVFAWSSMVDGLCKHGRLEDARGLFDAMPERNVVSWTGMIRGYVKGGMWEEGFELFIAMRREGSGINSTTLSVVLDGCDEYGRRNEGVQIHGLVVRMGFEDDVFLGDSIITMYCRICFMDAARRAFHLMKKKDVVSWNSLITGYVEHDEVEEASELFEAMPKKDKVSWTAMIVGFSRRGWMKESVRLFKAMPRKDEVAWTAIISGFTENGEYEDAFRWFDCMIREGVKLNPMALCSVLSALASLANLNQGVQVHACAVKTGFESDATTQSAIVSMYGKCGNLDEAYRIFSSITEPDLTTLNSMITGFAKHGLAREALHLFKKMEADGHKPNHVTFLGILSACSYAGLVEEGYHYFNSMSSTYSVEPRRDHYTCMVDIFGRAGLLQETLDLINSMPYEPHSAVWGALLSASQIHSDLGMAKIAAERILEMEPHNAAAYTTLSNAYFMAGLKEEEVEIRELQQSQGFKNNPGCSWTVLPNTSPV